MTDEIESRDDVTKYTLKHVAPNMKRRKLIFDSFTKLQTAKQSKSTSKEGEPKGGTLLYCWGAGYHGQLGINSKRKKCEMLPVQINFNEAVIQIACGGFHTAVLTEIGQVYTWGDGKAGQLGNLDAKFNMHPTPSIVIIDKGTSVIDIACGQYHTACVTKNGHLYTWGSGKYGQIGHGPKQLSRKPESVDRKYPWPLLPPFPNEKKKDEIEKKCYKHITYSKVSCGDKHTICLTNDNEVITFGSGQHGQLGNVQSKESATSGTDQSQPRVVKKLKDMGAKVKWIAAGSTVSACVTFEGHMYIWGFGESIHSKKPNIVYEPYLIDEFVKNGEAIAQVDIGQSHIVALTESGDVWAWGNLYIKRSVSSSEAAVANVRTPRLILKGENIKEISCGRYHTLALTDHGSMYSWGIGESGQLGHGKLESNEFPQIVDWILPNVAGKICCGDHHSFCLSSIRFHDVHPEVRKWKSIQNDILAMKAVKRRDSKNVEGVKTADILAIHKDREKLIAKKEESKERHEGLVKNVEGFMTRLEHEVQIRDEDSKNAARKPKKTGYEKFERTLKLRKSKVGKKKSSESSELSSLGENGDEEESYQPLQPRIAFLQKAYEKWLERKTTMTDKLLTSGLSVVKPNIKKHVKELFDQKKEFNKLCDIVARLQAEHQKLSKELSFLESTPDDEKQRQRNQKILDDLKMKLVTKDTQLMETVENKTNYDLYIIRMKEENLVISKSIDHLRHMVREHERLVSKLEVMQHRVIGQKEKLKHEIGNLTKDIQKFKQFSTDQLSRYKDMINSLAKVKKAQQQNEEEREKKINNRKKKLMNKLALDYEKKKLEAIEIAKKKANVYAQKEEYSARARKLKEATGLKEAKDIIDKFFSNDKITEELLSEITAKKELKKQLGQEKELVMKDIHDRQSSFKPSKWRDISNQETNMQEDNKRVKKLAAELERINDRMLIIKEGINSLRGDGEPYEEDAMKALDMLRSKIMTAFEVARPHMQISA